MPSPNNPPLLRGSLFTYRRKCGKPTCHCATGEPHSCPALSYVVDGATRILTLREEDIPVVRAGLQRYKKAQAQLKKDALKGNETLRRRIKQEKARAREQKR